MGPDRRRSHHALTERLSLVRLRLEGELHNGGIVGVCGGIVEDNDVADVGAAKQDVVVDIVLGGHFLGDIAVFCAKRTN